MIAPDDKVIADGDTARIPGCAATILGHDMKHLRRSRGRRGFSLIEVLLATGILLGCVIVIGEMSAIGRRHLTGAEELADAQRICQTKLNEILVGTAPIEPVERREIGDTAGWVYSVEIEPLGRLNLAALKVTVAQDTDDERRAKQFTLTRWIPDPNRTSDEFESDFAETRQQPSMDGGSP